MTQNPHEKISLWASTIAINVSVTICQLPIRQFCILFNLKPGVDPGFDQGGAPDRDRPKTAILGPQFCRILVLGPHFWWSGGGPGPPPGSAPVKHAGLYSVWK